MNDVMSAQAMFLHKKNAVRKRLSEMGVLRKDGRNKFDNYNYFSEAQYKKLFTDLFSDCGLEMSCDEELIEEIAGTEKSKFGRRVKMTFTLSDIDTGYSETTHSSGEGFDRGDKALYKAKTGALKYWLANTWMVATGDDAEAGSPGNPKYETDQKEKPKAQKAKAPVNQNAGRITPEQIDIITRLYKKQEIDQMVANIAKANNADLKSLEDINYIDASKMIAFRQKGE